MSKFRTPRITAGVQNKLYCLCSLGTVSHSYQFWKFVGKLPKSQFPDVSQGLSLQQAFPKIAFSQIAVSCLRQLTVLTFLCTSSIMDWSFQPLFFPASSPEMGSGWGVRRHLVGPYCMAHGTLITVLWQPEWERSLREMHVYVRLSPFSVHLKHHNGCTVVSQLLAVPQYKINFFKKRHLWESAPGKRVDEGQKGWWEVKGKAWTLKVGPG